MLVQLTIRNYALIQALDFEPSSGMNIITGETGAGKSIMLGAIGLLLGQRADVKALSETSEKCVIEGKFDIKSYELQSFFEAKDWDYEEETVIRREISTAGKSRIFVNDTPVTLEDVKELGGRLIDIHSQHDTLKLGSQTWQLGLIDDYAGLTEVKSRYQEIFRQWKSAQKAYETLKEAAIKDQKEVDFIRFQYQELKSAQLQIGEKERLEKELEWLQNQELINGYLSDIQSHLDESDIGVLSNLTKAIKSAEKLAKYHEPFYEWSERLIASRIEIADVMSSIHDLMDRQEAHSINTEQVESRLAVLYTLEKKHAVDSTEALLKIKDEFRGRLKQINAYDEQIARLADEIHSLTNQITEAADVLTKGRQTSAAHLVEAVTDNVKQLAMPNAMLDVAYEKCDFTLEGVDKFKFLFSANKGIKPAELGKVASGGEFSRLMLAIKAVMASKVAMPTIIFDEIDAGISGETGRLVGRMIRAMSANHQVITITHLPQMASLGDRHFFVYKNHDEQRTFSSIRRLQQDERVQEIAQMLSGSEPSQAAIATAKELLLEASNS